MIFENITQFQYQSVLGSYLLLYCILFALFISNTSINSYHRSFPVSQTLC